MIANLGKVNYLYKDFLFNNSQLKCSSDNKIFVKLINFDLVKPIKNLDSAIIGFNKTRIFFFILVKILAIIILLFYPK